MHTSPSLSLRLGMHLQAAYAGTSSAANSCLRCNPDRRSRLGHAAAVWGAFKQQQHSSSQTCALARTATTAAQTEPIAFEAPCASSTDAGCQAAPAPAVCAEACTQTTAYSLNR